MKTLYVSDLDGTLLNQHAQLSDYTMHSLTTLIESGLNFTIATARTAATACKILSPLPLRLPVILMNGVSIYDTKTKRYLEIKQIPCKDTKEIFMILKIYALSGFVYEIKNHSLTTYYEKLHSKAMKAFYEERVTKYQKKFVQVPDFLDLDPTDLVYISILNKKEHLDLAYKELSNLKNIKVAYYKDIYSEDDMWFMEIFSKEATKYNAVQYLRKKYEFGHIIGFGDNLNDIPLFKACDETLAVSNAKEELKAIASNIIESNLNNGVVKWIKENYSNT